MTISHLSSLLTPDEVQRLISINTYLESSKPILDHLNATRSAFSVRDQQAATDLFSKSNRSVADTLYLQELDKFNDYSYQKEVILSTYADHVAELADAFDEASAMLAKSFTVLTRDSRVPSKEFFAAISQNFKTLTELYTQLNEFFLLMPEKFKVAEMSALSDNVQYVPVLLPKLDATRCNDADYLSKYAETNQHLLSEWVSLNGLNTGLLQDFLEEEYLLPIQKKSCKLLLADFISTRKFFEFKISEGSNEFNAFFTIRDEKDSAKELFTSAVNFINKHNPSVLRSYLDNSKSTMIVINGDQITLAYNTSVSQFNRILKALCTLANYPLISIE